MAKYRCVKVIGDFRVGEVVDAIRNVANDFEWTLRGDRGTWLMQDRHLKESFMPTDDEPTSQRHGKRWEYLADWIVGVASDTLVGRFNKRGAEGWEMVQAVWDQEGTVCSIIWKREVASDA